VPLTITGFGSSITTLFCSLPVSGWRTKSFSVRLARPELEERPLADRSLQGSRTPHPLPELPLRQSFLRELLILSGGCRFNEGIHT
jgi:hypothetical protein